MGFGTTPRRVEASVLEDTVHGSATYLFGTGAIQRILPNKLVVAEDLLTEPVASLLDPATLEIPPCYQRIMGFVLEGDDSNKARART